MFGGLTGASEVTKTEILVKIKQKYPLAAIIPVIFRTLEGSPGTINAARAFNVICHT